MLDYISILAGGTCKINCSFCVGKAIRDNQPPHFAPGKDIAGFMDAYSGHVQNLSISGSTSDPMHINCIDEVLAAAEILFKYRVALHTCALDVLQERDEDFTYKLSRLTLSLHSIPDKTALGFIARHKENIRISVVYHGENAETIDNMEFFDTVPAVDFTIRKNVFDPQEPDLKGVELIGDVFNQPLYRYGHKRIVVWDFTDANKHINARYLWPNGALMRQCFWESLYKESGEG